MCKYGNHQRSLPCGGIVVPPLQRVVGIDRLGREARGCRRASDRPNAPLSDPRETTGHRASDAGVVGLDGWSTVSLSDNNLTAA